VIYVFYNNDPLADDLGGGAEHFRGLHRALLRAELPFRLVAARLQDAAEAPYVDYISRGSDFGRYYLALWGWFWRHRREFRHGDVFHFHRNYAAWPKLLLAPDRGAVVVSYHNVTGRVLAGMLGRLAAPLRAAMLGLERRVVALADAIICVSGRDRAELQAAVAPAPFAAARVIPAALDERLFARAAPAPSPPGPELARRLLLLGRISHQKNVPLAIETLEALVAAGEDYELTIAGRGEGSRELVQRIAASPASGRIRWLGAVPHEEAPGLLAEHGVLLLTSRYEASPTVVKEALRVMRPVVTTDVGDVADWLDEDATGFVCPGTAEGLAEGVRRAARLIREGRYRHTAKIGRLDESAIMDEVLDLYRCLGAR
jgi:glycosyltransferase involved in cell wall biosynthesis